MNKEPLAPAEALSPEQREMLLAELTCGFLDEARAGKSVRLEDYLERCPDEEAKDKLLRAINMSGLVDAAIAHRLNKALKEAGMGHLN